MYYWLKEPGCYGVYVISDNSDRIYHVQDGDPTQMKPPMQCFLKFKPYMEFIKKTETCYFDFEGPYAQNFGKGYLTRLHSFVSANVDSSSGHIQEPHSANPSKSPRNDFLDERRALNP